MTAHEPLTDMGVDGFPELVDALSNALVDLLEIDPATGVTSLVDIDYEAVAVELADTAWKRLHGGAA